MGIGGGACAGADAGPPPTHHLLALAATTHAHAAATSQLLIYSSVSSWPLPDSLSLHTDQLVAIPPMVWASAAPEIGQLADCDFDRQTAPEEQNPSASLA